MRRRLRRVVGSLTLFVCAAAQLAAQSAGARPFFVPKWAFPTFAANAPAIHHDSGEALHVPRSARSFTVAQLNDVLNPLDWFPESHRPAPNAVLHARKEVAYACAYCHLPTGQGRSENATLAGLHPDYILRQLADLKSGARTSVSPNMRTVALNITPEEAAAVAKYFGAMHARPQYRVIESAMVPGHIESNGIHVATAGADSEPIAGRLVDITDDFDRHELHDPNETFTVFVPPGAIARGRRIAQNIQLASPTRCATCHGVDLRGVALAPPIAGRSPAYILRQLIAFRTGTRKAETGAPMRIVVSQMALDDMVAVAAYAGSRRP